MMIRAISTYHVLSTYYQWGNSSAINTYHVSSTYYGPGINEEAEVQRS